METKQCGKCKIIKPVNEFHKDKYAKSGYTHNCGKCKSEEQKEYRKNNPGYLAKKRSSYRENSPYYYKEYYKKNIEKIKEYGKKRYEDNSERLKEANKKWRLNNSEKCRIYTLQYKKDNPEIAREASRKFNKKRYLIPKNRLSSNISRLIRKSLKYGKNGSHWEGLLNYTLIDLANHLEKQFKDGMTWVNQGMWHIDHIIPVSWWQFNSYTDREFKQCWSLANLQPLWALENIRKSNKIIYREL